jgi:hypothetical protein
MKLSNDRVNNYRLNVEMMGILISDHYIFGMISYDQMRGWVNYLFELLAQAVENLNNSTEE